MSDSQPTMDPSAVSSFATQASNDILPQMPAPLLAAPLGLPQPTSYPLAPQSVSDSDLFRIDSPGSPGTRDIWIETLDRVIKGIVNINVTRSHKFDTQLQGKYVGTGFVVDKSTGIILSNRHIVGPGQIDARATFNNYEEVELQAIYYDPVHDFGFFRYDPSNPKLANVEQIQLFPEGAKVGLDIQVCGSNGGEKWSILTGRLARLDRHAPSAPGPTGYSDFNINYFQAASKVAGGLSGAPVLDIQGRAIAITAARTLDQSTALYLPLEGAVRALKLIQQGTKVMRGTLQTEFMYMPFHDLRSLGFPEEVEKLCCERNPAATGLLLVVKLLPEGPGNIAGLELGDIVTECFQESFGRRFSVNFQSLWEVIDESIGKEIVLTIYRGKERKEFTVIVQDLDEITPKRFLEIGNATIHNLSYHMARGYNVPCKGLYVMPSRSGLFNWATRMGMGSILIYEVDGKPVPTLESFVEVIKRVPERKRVLVKYRRTREDICLDELDLRYFPSAEYILENGIWQRKSISLDGAPIVSVESNATIGLEPAETWREKWRQALVWIVCRVPHAVDITVPGLYEGPGVVVALDPIPLILVSRGIISQSLCDISVIIASKYIPAKILYLGSFVIVTVNRESMPPIPVPTIAPKKPKIGDKIEIIGLDKNRQLVCNTANIRSITVNNLPRAWNQPHELEAIYLDHFQSCYGGVLVDPETPENGLIAFAFHLPTPYRQSFAFNYQQYIQPICEALAKGEEVRLWSHGWSHRVSHLDAALDMGLIEPHISNIREIARTYGAEPRVVMVNRKVGFKNFPASEQTDFQLGDYILQIDQNPVGRIADLRWLAQKEYSNVLILRNGKELLINSRGVAVPSQSTLKIISWAGLLLQQSVSTLLEPTPEFLAVVGKEGIERLDEMVLIAEVTYGSTSFGILYAFTWILEVDNEKVRKLEDILKIIEKRKGGESIDRFTRVKVLYADGRTPIVGVKLGSKLQPPWILEVKEDSWEFRELE